MRISVHEQGGFADLDRRIDIDGAIVKITDAKPRRRTRSGPLGPAQQKQVEKLATQMAAVNQNAVSKVEDLPPDAMITRIAVEDQGVRRMLKVVSGADVPGVVWEFLGLLRSVSSSI